MRKLLNKIKGLFKKETLTYEKVKDILCEGCRSKLPSVRLCDEQKWYHAINGKRIPCEANDWRNKFYQMSRGENG